MIQNGLTQIRGCVSVAYTDTRLLLCFRGTQLFSAALNRVADQLSNVERCSFQVADLGNRTGQRCSGRQLLEEGFNQRLPLLERETLGCGNKLVNGHCAYSFAGGIYRIEYNTLWGIEGGSFPPQANAAYVHLYGIGRDDADYILETFPIVKRKDEQAHGEYRTKRVILDIYDAMQQAMETGVAYQTRRDPPPANGWTPPEVYDTATGGQGDGAMEDAAHSSADFQRRAESAVSQPTFHFGDAK